MGTQRHNFTHAVQRYHAEQEHARRMAGVQRTFNARQSVHEVLPKPAGWWRRFWRRVTRRA